MRFNFSFPSTLARLAALAGLAGAPAAARAQVQAVPADRLLETIGVGTRFDWQYNDDKGPATKLALENIGFRYLRIGLGAESNDWTGYQQYWSSYAAQKGLKLLLQCEGESKASLTNEFNTWMQTPSVVWGLEGANETYGRDWWSSEFPNSFELQKFIYSLAQPKGLKVLTWTAGGAAIPYVENWPNPDAYCTHANFHAYSWDTSTDDGKQTLPLWQDFTLNHDETDAVFSTWNPKPQATNYGHVGGLWAMDQWTKNPSKPKTISEWGFTWEAQGGESYQNVDSELSRAKYVLRNSLELLNAKVDKAFYYSLVDQHDKFGIANQDGSLKQSGQGLANLFALLRDPGHANDNTGSLTYSLSTSSGIGTSDDHYHQTNEIHQSLLQKSNGHFILALWADKPSHKGDTGSEAATLTLGSAASEVKIYLPLNGTTAVQTLGAGTQSISLSGNVAIPDHPLLVEITPGSSTPPPASTATQINVGGAAVSPFAAEAGVNGGNQFSSTNTITTSGVTNAAPAAVYQTGRWGTFSVTVGGLTAGASKKVRLHFAETAFSQTGQRKFNVGINGSTVLTDFDVYAAAGAANKAVVKEFTATVNSSGQVVVNFGPAAVDNAFVNGVEVLPNATSPGVTYYRLKNRWQNTYLFDNGAQAGYGATASGDAYLWAVESSGGYTQFKNKATGDYLNIETSQDYVECTPAQAGWWSKDWTLEDYSGYKMIKNRWQNTQYVHVENLRGYAQHTPISLGTWSSQWTLEAVNSTGARQANPVAAAEPAPAEGTGAGAALSAYPNPSPDGRATLQLVARDAQSAVVYVRDGQGQLVSLLTVPVRAGQTEWRLPNTLPAGTYFVQTRLDGQAQKFTLKVE